MIRSSDSEWMSLEWACRLAFRSRTRNTKWHSNWSIAFSSTDDDRWEKHEQRQKTEKRRLIRPRRSNCFSLLVVGSAAYNLLMICALCIVAIKGPETRRIKLYNVFIVKILFSSADVKKQMTRIVFSFRWHRSSAFSLTSGSSLFYQWFPKTLSNYGKLWSRFCSFHWSSS